MFKIMIICIIIVFVVLILTLLTTNKAYKYEHTIDPLEPNENEDQTNKKDDTHA
ncbi:YtzI protein [Sutcliffiella rhizosphaerae]|uniref:YtzI protein n=1 Tax=Sutcliffiella rhizosphaerae TaxID=2880967 RepID=A0ABN8AFB6_9BACI|nr:YtzI protein [Sutcliffiella rhizosphaerae]CAG9622422.1 hypothetical protein BACCIP111883_03213 [Sutcliffiella rhizosphaerae]